MRRVLSLLLLFLLLACAQGGRPSVSRSAMETMQRLPPVVSGFQRIPLTVTSGQGEVRAAAAFYRQVGGTSVAYLMASGMPDPSVAEGLNGQGSQRALDRAVGISRQTAAQQGGTMIIRHRLNARRDGRPVMDCVMAELRLPSRPGAAPSADQLAAGGTRLLSDCVGVVGDRFVTFSGVSADSGPEAEALIALGMTLVDVLNNPNAPVMTGLEPGQPGQPIPPAQAAPAPPPAPAPASLAPPGTVARGRGYSI